MPCWVKVALELLPRKILIKYIRSLVRSTAAKRGETIEFTVGWTRLLEELTADDRGVAVERVEELQEALGIEAAW